MTTAPAAGSKLRAAVLAALVRNDSMVKRGTRSTSSTATATEIGVLRIDGVTVETGRRYLISTFNYLSSTVNGDSIRTRLRYTTDGSTAGVTSTIMQELVVVTPSAVGSASGTMERLYSPAANQSLSILLTVMRAQGTGNVQIAVVDSDISLDVIDLGPDPGNAGTSL